MFMIVEQNVKKALIKEEISAEIIQLRQVEQIISADILFVPPGLIINNKLKSFGAFLNQWKSEGE